MKEQLITHGKIGTYYCTSENVLEQYTWRLRQNNVSVAGITHKERNVALTFILHGMPLTLTVIDKDVLEWAEEASTRVYFNEEIPAFYDILHLDEATSGLPNKLLCLSYKGSKLNDYQLRKIMIHLVDYYGGSVPPEYRPWFSRKTVDEISVESGTYMKGADSLKELMERSVLG